MSVPLYMDVHVKSAISNGLRQRGIDVLTAQEDGQGVTSDEELLQRAHALGRLLFTQDDDFLVIAQEWQSSGRSFAGITYAHQLGITVGQAVSLLHLVCKVMTVDELRNTILFLPF